MAENLNNIATPANQRTGSGFTNLQQYLGANEGNDLGNVITNGVNQQLGNTDTTLQAAQGDFANQVGNADQAGSSSDITNEQNILNNALNNPNQVSQQDITQFGNWRNANYNGPNQLTDVSEFPQLTGQLNYLNSIGTNLQNPGGKSQLLNSFINKPNYSQGDQNFDTTLLGSNPKNSASFNALGQQIQNTNNAVTGAESQAGAQAQNIADQTNQFKQGLYNNLGLDQTGNYTGANQQGLIEQQNSNLQNQVASDTAAQNAAYTNSLSDLQNLSVGNNPYLASLSGVTTYGVNPANTNLLTKSIAPNASNVASPQQAATINALSQLAGINNTFITDPSQVGTYNAAKPVSFDTPAYLSQVQTAKNAYNNYLNSMQGNSGINNFGAVTGANASSISSMTPAQAQAFLQQYGLTFNTGAKDQGAATNGQTGPNSFGILTNGSPLGTSSDNVGYSQMGGNFQGTLPQIISQDQADLGQFKGVTGNALTGNNVYQADTNQMQQAQNLLNIINNAYGENQVIQGAPQPISTPRTPVSRNI